MLERLMFKGVEQDLDIWILNLGEENAEPCPQK